MGNCFGKQSSSEEAFSGPGRTVGSGPPARAEPNARATIPARTAQQSQGRTLGGGDAASSDDDPRTAAARAAEIRDEHIREVYHVNGAKDERASKAQSKGGVLGKKLDAQRQQTRTNTLDAVSRENRLARDADAAAQTRNWD